MVRKQKVKAQPVGIISAGKSGVKSDVEAHPKQTGDFAGRIAPLDAKLASLDARIERNKADLARTNAELTLKIAEMLKRLASGR